MHRLWGLYNYLRQEKQPPYYLKSQRKERKNNPKKKEKREKNIPKENPNQAIN